MVWQRVRLGNLVICRNDKAFCMPRNWIAYELPRKSVGEISKVQSGENDVRHVGLGARSAGALDGSRRSVRRSRI